MEHGSHDSHHEDQELDHELYMEDYTYKNLSEEEKKKKRKHLKEHKAHHAEHEQKKKSQKAKEIAWKKTEKQFVGWMFGLGFNFGFKCSRFIANKIQYGKLEHPAPLGGVGKDDSPIDVYRQKAHKLASKFGFE